MGLSSPRISPLSFVSAVVCVKFGLFAFWPLLSEKSRIATQAFAGATRGERRSPRRRKTSLGLWDEADPRLDLALFSTNIPTFVLNAEQRFLDWNPAFGMIFGELSGIKRGAHVSHWYEHLDNFRRLPKRTDGLYGEGILPLTDRERATFISKTWGRMVFTRIMSPVIDHSSGRIIGWTVVLNINSVNKRQEFFERLYGVIKTDARRARYAASYDGLFDASLGRKRLIKLHAASFSPESRVLDLGCGTGALALALARRGAKVTAVDHEVHQLRRLRTKAEAARLRVRVVRQDPGDLHDVPAQRFSGVTMMHVLHRLDDPALVLQRAFQALRPGGCLTISVLLDEGGIEAHYNAVRSELEALGRYETLKHQFNHVLELERDLAIAVPYRLPSRADVRALVLEAGFMIEEEHAGLESGHTLLIVARKT